MYQPPAFVETDLAAIHAFVRAHPFATLVTRGPDGLFVTHLPVVFRAERGAFFGHIARANPHADKADPKADAVLIFSGPSAYISPNWYPSKADTHRMVPTWNYAVVHAYGRVSFPADDAFLRQNLADLTAQHENGRENPWKLADAPEDFIARQLKGIIGVEFAIDRFIAKMKLSQNRSAEDYAGVVAGLSAEANAGAQAIAALMRDR